jgi:SAM-dependent methyltransferase
VKVARLYPRPRDPAVVPAPVYADWTLGRATSDDDLWPFGVGIRRSVRLLNAFRFEQTDPDRFYRQLAADAVSQVRLHTTVDGSRVVDVGGGIGYFTEAFVRSGATCILVDPYAGSAGRIDHPTRPASVATAFRPGRLTPGVTIGGGGSHLPLPDGAADIAFASNILEHVPDPEGVVRELLRVTRPGGIVYVSFTSWLSPWGGHETSPWHYLGGERAARRFERKHGLPPRNVYGESLFAVHVGPTLRLIRGIPGAEVVQASPRYYPRWMDGLVRVPGLREVATWNLLVILRRLPPGEPAPLPAAGVHGPTGVGQEMGRSEP